MVTTARSWIAAHAIDVALAALSALALTVALDVLGGWARWVGVAFSLVIVAAAVAAFLRSPAAPAAPEERTPTAEDRFRAVMESTCDVLFVLACVRDSSGRVVDFRVESENGIGRRLLDRVLGGGRRGAGERVGDLFPILRDRGVIASFIRVFHERAPIESTFDLDQDGDMLHLRYRVLPVDDGVAILGRDDSAQHRVEMQLQRLQTMDALGRLAGGVAHDINNVLSVVSCTASLLVDDLEPGDPRREDVEAIVSAATRGAALTRKLLTFSRRQVVESVDIDLNELVGRSEASLRDALPPQIELVLRLEAGDVVRADADRLAQVLLGLVHNARDAISGPGRIVVRTRNVDLDAPAPSRFGAIGEGRYVRLTVEDTGAGMSEETMARIFEPFFTTKKTAGARGLGLSTVYGVVVQAGGHVDVTSRPGEGSRFSIYLPRIDRARETVLDSERRPVARARGTVLVVDDEELVRRSIARVLGREGFTVREAEDGLAALSVLDASDGAIDLLITDAIMPRMGGAALIEQAAVRFPAMPILMISGCTDKELVTGELCGKRRAFLTKPVEIPVLLSALDDLLGHGHAPSPPPVPSLYARIA